MAKERMINTRIWSDNWVSELDPIEKLLFVYFLTNSYTNISGVYELPLKVAAVETGIDPSMLGKILPRLEPKVIHREGWVIMPNFPRYQNLKSKDVVLGIQREFDSLPERIKKEAMGGGWGDGLGIAPDTKPNLTKLTSVAIAPQVIEVKESQEEEKTPKSKPKYPNAKTVYSWFPKPQKAWEINTTELKHAELLFLRGEKQVRSALALLADHGNDPYCPEVLKPSHLEQKWSSLFRFAHKKGLV